MRALLLVSGGLCVTSFALAVALVPIVRAVALRSRFLDAPGGRKAHAAPTVRLGGVAIVLALVLPLLALPLLGPRAPSAPPLAWSLLAGLGVIHATGVLDDLLGARFPWWAKLAGQVAAAAIAVVGGARLDLLVLPGLNAVVSVLWIVTIANAMNFLDHADGVCAGVAAIAGAILFVVAALLGQAGVACALAALVGALAGFLVYNAPPASIFMGDGGSHAIGYLLASLTLVAAYVAPTGGPGYLPALLPLAVLGLPLFDLVVVVFARLRRGQPVHHGDRNHLHHRLRRLGMSDREATFAVWLAALALGGGAVALPFATWPGAIALGVQALAMMGLIAALMLFGERAGGASGRGRGDAGADGGGGG